LQRENWNISAVSCSFLKIPLQDVALSRLKLDSVEKMVKFHQQVAEKGPNVENEVNFFLPQSRQTILSGKMLIHDWLISVCRGGSRQVRVRVGNTGTDERCESSS
jgi:hypothetical protein